MPEQKKTYSKLFDNIDYSDSESYAYLTHFLQTKDLLNGSAYSKVAKDKILKDDKLKETLLNGNGSPTKELKFEEYIDELLQDVEFDVPFPPVSDPDFKFIDLFAGVGGFRLALQELGGKCVFSSEIDKFSKEVYESNFGEVPFGDIKNFTNENIDDEKLGTLIPDHEILAAGFPCQAFSIAGRRGGFEDTRGTLFFDIARILRAKKPKAFILENVKGLNNHRGGKTIETILKVLREDLDYTVPDPEILNAKDFGVPQNRERIIIVGFRKDLGIDEDQFEYPDEARDDSPFKTGKSFSDVKEGQVVSTKYYLSNTYLQTLKDHKERHKKKGNGFGYEIIDEKDTANAIVVGGMGRERNLIHDDRITDYTPVTNIKGKVSKEDIRRMTPREWARLQGFPDKYKLEAASDTQLYKQFGNSVPVPVIEAVGKEVLSKLKVEVDS